MVGLRNREKTSEKKSYETRLDIANDGDSHVNTKIAGDRATPAAIRQSVTGVKLDGHGSAARASASKTKKLPRQCVQRRTHRRLKN